MLIVASPAQGTILSCLARVVLACAALLCVLPGHAGDLLLELRGQPAPGSLLIGRAAPGAEVFLEDRPVTVSAAGWFALGFGRDAEGTRTLALRKDGRRETHRLTLAPRSWHIQRIEGVPRETVTPPEGVLARIREEAVLVRQARSVFSEREDFRESFIWPTSGPITGVYGSQRFYNGEPRNPHYGIDIAAPEGAAVYAPAGGTVRLAHPDMFYSGGTLILDHGHGVFSTFLHLSRIVVEEGQEVRQGQMIAEVGSTGRSTGPHLDWRLNWFGERLDPQWFMGAMDAARVDTAIAVVEENASGLTVTP